MQRPFVWDGYREQSTPQDPFHFPVLPCLFAESSTLFPNQTTGNVRHYVKVLTIRNLPDKFYDNLQEQINRAFAANILPAVEILGRKFLEGLIVDILRKRFGMSQVDLFFDINRHRFHDFHVLLKNLEDQLGDFPGAPTPFNTIFLKKINEYRELGNSSAHVIEIYLDRKEVEANLKKLEPLIGILIKVLDGLI